MKKRALGLPTTNTQDVPTKANQLANFPLNFLRTGYYSDGKLHERMTESRRWLATRSATTSANNLYTSTKNIYSQNSSYRGLGFALR